MPCGTFAAPCHPHWRRCSRASTHRSDLPADCEDLIFLLPQCSILNISIDRKLFPGSPWSQGRRNNSPGITPREWRDLAVAHGRLYSVRLPERGRIALQTEGMTHEG